MCSEEETNYQDNGFICKDACMLHAVASLRLCYTKEGGCFCKVVLHEGRRLVQIPHFSLLIFAKTLLPAAAQHNWQNRSTSYLYSYIMENNAFGWITLHSNRVVQLDFTPEVKVL